MGNLIILSSIGMAVIANWISFLKDISGLLVIKVGKVGYANWMKSKIVKRSLFLGIKSILWCWLIDLLIAFVKFPVYLW